MSATTDLVIAVLIKDFVTAKSRLAPSLSAHERERLARLTARRAVRAAAAVAPAVAVCGSAEAARLAATCGAEAIVEAKPDGQNRAAQVAIDAALRRGALAVLLLSSDLPGVTAVAIRRLLRAAGDGLEPLAVAARAAGRQGTNALLLRPPQDFALHFGQGSLQLFAAEASRRGRRFVVHDDPALALDLDEPGDLVAWREQRRSA
ncbi:MAG: NTP transferase domain-containing protein [Candidatus Dormibacteraeota bacterium]|nr:NTP transferase domain-containing protein [Candidatus Dormibacteraeota bacterium]